MNKTLLCFFILNIVLVYSCLGHGDLDIRIAAASKEIKIYPDSAYLYFKRGKLYFQHNEYKKSIKDLKKSLSKGNDSGEQKLLFARNYFRLKKFKKTLVYAESILANDAKNVLALKIKAQALSQLNKFRESALIFEKVIEYTNKSFPENYIDASVAWENLNSDLGYRRAILIVEEGIDTLGDLISLFERLTDLAIKRKDYKAAIEIKKRVLSFVSRKERTYFDLCELHFLDNNPEKAKEYLALSKEHFYKLPIRIQNTSFMKKLIEDIEAKEILLK